MPATATTPQTVRTMSAIGAIGAAATVAFGAAVQAVVIPATSVSDDLWRFPWSADTFVVISAIYLAIHVLVIVGLLGLQRSGATGGTRLGSAGIAVSVAGTGLLIAGELASMPIRNAALDSTEATLVGSLFGLGTAASAVGFLLAGIAIRRAGVWSGWHRSVLLATGAWTVVLCGLAMTKALALGVAIYGLGLLLTMLALRAETPAPAGPAAEHRIRVA